MVFQSFNLFNNMTVYKNAKDLQKGIDPKTGRSVYLKK